jgi:hypothetical protein
VKSEKKSNAYRGRRRTLRVLLHKAQARDQYFSSVYLIFDGSSRGFDVVVYLHFENMPSVVQVTLPPHQNGIISNVSGRSATAEENK